MVRLVQRRGVSAEQASELPPSWRALRSPPLPGTLTRSIAPTVAERAASIPGPAARPATSATVAANPTRRPPKRPLEPKPRLIVYPPASGARRRGTARPAPKAEPYVLLFDANGAIPAKGDEGSESSPAP